MLYVENCEVSAKIIKFIDRYLGKIPMTEILKMMESQLLVRVTKATAAGYTQGVIRECPCCGLKFYGNKNRKSCSNKCKDTLATKGTAKHKKRNTSVFAVVNDYKPAPRITGKCKSVLPLPDCGPEQRWLSGAQI